MLVHPQLSLLSVLPNARTREPLGEGEAKSRSVGKTDAGKEERAETVSDSSSKAVDKPARLIITPDLSRHPKTKW